VLWADSALAVIVIRALLGIGGAAADAFVTGFASVGAVGAVLTAVSAYVVWRLVPADLSLDDAQH
jgi:hypothetical protein